MNYQDYYKNHCVTAEEAISKVHSGNSIFVGHAIGEPSALLDALVKFGDSLVDVKIYHMVCMGKGEYCKPEMKDHFRHISFFAGGLAREAIADGRADFIPCYFSEIPKMITEEFIPVDVALLQVSPPDQHGYVSLGVSVDYAKAAAGKAKLLIVQVNECMPRTLGDSFIHVTEIDYFVKQNAEIIELAPSKISAVEEAIGEHCASLIENGSTLQLGIGSLPDAVLKFLKKKKDLGIHSEMFSDGVVDLINEGIINNQKKTLFPGKAVVTFLMGTRKLYDFVDNNPMIYMAPVDFVNDPYVIAQNNKMVSINSCVQVDFMGQVASESIGLKQISGVGGQVDFVRGANLSQGGKSIIAIQSVTGGGKVSKIVPFLDNGAAVTTSRCDVRFIVTEYGIADLKGKTLKERARSLIEIAHPNFKPLLIEEWEKRFTDHYA
jgi:4-hydroxybutyrate CoA-transferase